MAPVADRAPDIVAIAGFGACAEVWRELERSLAPRYRLLPVDLPGQGGRDAAEAGSLEAFTRTLAAEVQRPAVWMGWSAGALVALKAASLFPRQVRGVVAVGMGPRFLNAPDWPSALSAEALDAFRSGIETEPEATLNRFFALQTRTRAGTDRPLLKKLRTLAQARGRPGPAVLAQLLEWLKCSDLRLACGAIRCPVLAVLGSDDALVPQSVRGDLLRLGSNWGVEVIEGAGHVPFLSHRHRFQRRLEKFVSTVTRTTAPETG